MYSTNLANSAYTNRILATGVKMYELIKLAVRSSGYRNNTGKEYMPFIVNAMSRGFTVIDIGWHKRDYIFDMIKMSKLPGRLLSFEAGSGCYGYLKKMTHLLHFENISLEQLNFADQTDPTTVPDSRHKGATVIDFNILVEKTVSPTPGTDTIDHYCATHFIIPALIKIKLDSNHLNALEGVREMMRKYKPQIIIETAGKSVSRDTLLSTFSLLKDLNYKGYFLLDTIKVPLANFDFSIYQNEVLGYYCNHFLFE